MPLNTHAIQESLLAIWRAPIKRYSVMAGGAALVALVVNLTGQEPIGHPVAPPPIIQGEQLRFPAGHPQLALLSTATAVAANSVVIELPARLVWNEEKTERLYPAFAGRVMRLNADVGQTVQAGQVLATLASPEFGAAQADTAKAQADARFFERALDRQTELFEAGIVSRKDLEQAQADAQRAKAEVARAQARTQLYGSGGNAVNQQLGLSATVSGVVVERNLSAGQEVRPEQGGPGALPLFVVTDPRSLWVQIDAREADVASLQPGTQIALTLPNFPEQRFAAKIAATGDFIDGTSRTVKVRAVIDNPQRLLKAEMLADAKIERRLSAGVLVPASAIQLRGTEHWAYVQKEPGVFEPRKVALGYEGLQQVLVTSGLKEGELVVKENSLLLAREFRNAQEQAKPHTPDPQTNNGKAAVANDANPVTGPAASASSTGSAYSTTPQK
jgi:cobalt-zinc-cadmium efflux system membrane fusion protein